MAGQWAYYQVEPAPYETDTQASEDSALVAAVGEYLRIKAAEDVKVGKYWLGEEGILAQAYHKAVRNA